MCCQQISEISVYVHVQVERYTHNTWPKYTVQCFPMNLKSWRMGQSDTIVPGESNSRSTHTYCHALTASKLHPPWSCARPLQLHWNSDTICITSMTPSEMHAAAMPNDLSLKRIITLKINKYINQPDRSCTNYNW